MQKTNQAFFYYLYIYKLPVDLLPKKDKFRNEKLFRSGPPVSRGRK